MRRLAALVCAVTLASCSPAPGTPDGESCLADSECLPARLCSGVCTIECTTHDECLPVGVCGDGLCYPFCAYEGDGWWSCPEGFWCDILQRWPVCYAVP